MNKPSALSARLVNAGALFYTLWLLLPAVQTTVGAVGGVIAVALFGAGVALDTPYVKANWGWLLGAAACAAVMPVIWWKFMARGASFLGFYVQHATLWLAPIYAGYARMRGDRRLWRGLKWALLGAVCITVCTTTGWLIEGMLREGDRVYAYSRSLGYAGEGREAYLKELMLRNIGGYEFVYAMVAALPLTCAAMSLSGGWKRAAFAALLTLQTVMIVLSQYTYAMVFAALILAVELLALLLRRVMRGRISLGASLLWALVPFVAVFLLREPIVGLAAQLCRSIGMENMAYSLEQLLVALQGGITAADSRMGYYLTALQGFGASPLVGSMLGGEALLSRHSDLLDLLSGMGLLGAALVGGMVWLMSRGLLRGVRRHPQRAQLAVCALAVLATAALGTVVYSRDVFVIAAFGALLMLEEA